MPRIRFGNRAGTAWSLGSQSGRVGGGGRRTTEGQGDPVDWVTIKFGTSLKSLSEVKVIRNLENPDTGEIRDEVKYTLRCKEFAYRFEFASNP